ncbi:MAG: preprotein translocase subunit SecE [Proteobacteria bacterium]|nr:preprotein translocase subunit SecE [Pseudomonadota bacterium]
MNNNKKYVNLLFILAGGIVWFLSQYYVRVLVGRFQLGRVLGSTPTEIIEQALPLLLGVATFVVLRTNTKSYAFSSDAIGELTRVQWPQSKDVRLGTIVVIVTVLLAGVFFGFLDMGIIAVIKAILGA